MRNFSLKKKNRADDEQDDEDFEYGSQLGRNLFVNVKKYYSFDYHMDESIGNKSDFRRLLQLIYNMTDEDSLRLFIGGPGGNIDTLLEIINAIDYCKGRVFAVLTGEASSAHSILALAVSELQVCARGRLMIHNASIDASGKTQEAASSLNAGIKVCHDLFKEFYTGFLTEQEMQDLLIGKDFHMAAPEILKRLKKRAEYRKLTGKPLKSGVKQGVIRS